MEFGDDAEGREFPHEFGEGLPAEDYMSTEVQEAHQVAKLLIELSESALVIQ